MMNSSMGVDSEEQGILQRLTAHFVPDGFDGDTQSLFRARVVVALSFALSVFGPIYAILLYSLTGSVAQMVATLMATVGVIAAPFLMKRDVSFLVLGNWLTACGYALFVYVASQEMGPSVLLWQVVFAMLAALIAGRKSALIWLAVMSGTTAYFYLSMIAGAPAEGILVTPTELVWEMSLVIGMFVAAMTLTLSYEALKNWALEQFRQKEAHTRAILEAAPDGIITVSSQGQVGDFNRAAEELFDYEQFNVDEALFSNLVPSIDYAPPEAADEEREELIDGEVFEADSDQPSDTAGGLEAWLGETYEAEALRSGGESFPAEVSVTRIENDDRFVAVLRDITERKKAQQALRTARDRAVEANEAKSRFLANISHELRTPLNAIIGYSELVGDDLEYLGEPEIKADVDKVGKAGHHLLSLINEILDLSKVEAGKMEIFVEEIFIKAVVDEVRDTIQPLIDTNNNELHVDTKDAPETMRVDRTKLRQILINLLSNASKFTDGDLIKVKVFAETRDGSESVIFEVIDRGIGIPEDKLDELFEAFKQADESTTRNFGGTGLGLTICRHFTDLMGGVIDVESEVGEGSTFRVTLPVDVSAAQTPEPGGDDEDGDDSGGDVDGSDYSDKAVASGSKLTMPDGAPQVLVIDDDPTVHQLMERFLGREGFVVDTCAGGKEALKVARESEPDIITLDVLMPEVDGWNILQEIKSDDQLADTPVVMLTIVSDRNMGFSLGATDYLTKPVEPKRLVSVLTSHLGEANHQPILIAEDDDDTREVLRRIVSNSGWDTVCTADGRQALELLDDGVDPSAILLDLMMPKLDGFELLEELRVRRQETDLPVIVVSAADLTEAEQMMLEQNTNKILKKGSYAKEQLVGELRAALG